MPSSGSYYYPQMINKGTSRSTKDRSISFDDSYNLDAFGRLRIADPTSIFHHKQLTNNTLITFDRQLTGSASTEYRHIDSSTNMVVSASGDFVIHQQRVYNNYQSGKGQQIIVTGRMPPATNVEQRIGYFTGDLTPPYAAKDGIYFSCQSGTFYVNIAKNGVINAVPQASWNIDPMDGTGPSEIVLNKTASQIFLIDFGWLGFARVRMGFHIGGEIIYVHEFRHANSVTSPYITSPNQPIRYEIRSLGGVGELDHVCSSVVSEGSLEPINQVGTVSTKNIQPIMATPDVIYAVLGIRLSGAHLDSKIDEVSISMISETGNDSFRWIISLNPVLTGTFNYVGDSSTTVQVASSSGDTVTIGGQQQLGRILDEGYSKDGAVVSTLESNAIGLGSDISGTQDQLVLSVQPLSANQSIQAVLKWRELL